VVRHFAAIENLTTAQWEHAMAVNVTAAFHTLRRVLPGMRQRGWGRIVNMSSIYGQRGAPDRSDYITTKAALVGLTRAVAAETATQDITCNAVCPGSVATPGTTVRVQALMQAEGVGEDEATRRFLTGKQPSGRFIPAESVAAMVVFLCGPAGRDITGALLPVDGGWLAS
jgi:3-hydroxybutyrate dehydrogenase